MKGPAARAGAWRQYICRICGLIYDEAVGDADSGLAAGTRFEDIPDDWACPICGVSKADFEPCVPAQAQAVRSTRVPAFVARAAGARGHAGVVIVGAGRAGWQVAQALREQDAALPITLVTACAGDVYDKPLLSVAVARGLDPAGLVRESARAAATRLNVQLRADTHAVAIDTTTQRLRTTRGTLRYRHLVLAQGALPAVPAVLPPQQVWRVNDLVAYRQLRAVLASGAQHVAIVGAGLVGCELANDLALAGHRITLLDQQDRPLAAQLPAAAGARLLAAWQALPISFVGGVQVVGVHSRPGAAGGWRVQLQGDRHVDVDQVIAATGLRAAGRLAASAALAYDSGAGGIVVDAHSGQTSQPGIYALGDCVVVQGQASRYIEAILHQARGIAAHILGLPVVVSPIKPPVLHVKTSTWPITVTGVLHGGGAWQVDRDDSSGLHMRRLAADGQQLATLVARHSSG